MDSWLPDLEVGEFAGQIRRLYPAMELLRVDGAAESGAARSPRRNELLHALREAQELDERYGGVGAGSGCGAGLRRVVPVRARFGGDGWLRERRRRW